MKSPKYLQPESKPSLEALGSIYGWYFCKITIINTTKYGNNFSVVVPKCVCLGNLWSNYCILSGNPVTLNSLQTSLYSSATLNWNCWSELLTICTGNLEIIGIAQTLSYDCLCMNMPPGKVANENKLNSSLCHILSSESAKFLISKTFDFQCGRKLLPLTQWARLDGSGWAGVFSAASRCQAAMLALALAVLLFTSQVTELKNESENIKKSHCLYSSCFPLVPCRGWWWCNQSVMKQSCVARWEEPLVCSAREPYNSSECCI